MKKIAFVLMILTVFSASVFAAPGSLSASLDNYRPVDGKTYAIGVLNAGGVSHADDLFADVGAVQLTDTDAQAVEGEGWITGLFKAVVTVVKVAVNVATENYVGAIIAGITGGIDSYYAWIDPNTP
jgi:hypothetical protein